MPAGRPSRSLAGSPDGILPTTVSFSVAATVSSTRATWLRPKPAFARPWRYAANAMVVASTLRRQQRFAEAEPLYRECLTSREKNCPNAWYTHYTRFLLGATLMGKRKYEEAEPLLVAGYQGMR